MLDRCHMKAIVTNIQGYSIHDGPGIRTVVFFKGCGLGCLWCANPECIRADPERLYPKSCAHMRKCLAACPEGAVKLTRRSIELTTQSARHCGLCADGVPIQRRLRVAVRSMSAL
jgi:pyruvate formate lyase activating enzyme